MWTFNRSKGQIVSIAGEAFPAYSGHGDGVDNPAEQQIKDVGPIPAGIWDIGLPMYGTKHGNFVLPLTPEPQTQTFGRSGFLIHGDEVAHPGEHLASLGCVITAADVRVKIWSSNDHKLQVI